MTLNIARLDAIIKQHTALSGWQDLLETRESYVPTLDLRICPDFVVVAMALVEVGRDAYVTGAPMGPYFAKTRYTTPTSELPAPGTEVPAEPPVDEEEEGDGEDVPHEIVYHLYYEDTCDGDYEPEFASDQDFSNKEEARQAAVRLVQRERRDIRLCEEIVEQGEICGSETLDTFRA